MKKLSLLVVLVLFSVMFSACKNEPTEPTEEKTLADTLIGEWKLVKITGGYTGEGLEVECSETLKIFSQLNDSTFNFIQWECNHLYLLNDKIVLSSKRSPASMGAHRLFCIPNGSVVTGNDYYCSFWFYKENEQLFMHLSEVAYDAYEYHFKKINGEFSGN